MSGRCRQFSVSVSQGKEAKLYIIVVYHRRRFYYGAQPAPRAVCSCVKLLAGGGVLEVGDRAQAVDHRRGFKNEPPVVGLVEHLAGRVDAQRAWEGGGRQRKKVSDESLRIEWPERCPLAPLGSASCNPREGI